VPEHVRVAIIGRAFLTYPGSRNTTLCPGSTLGFRRATRHLDVSEYHVITA